MRVLHICSYYTTSQLYKNLFLSLEDVGIENEVYIPVRVNQEVNRNIGMDFKKTNLLYSNDYNKFDRFIFKLKVNKIYNSLLRQINIKNIDIVHAHSLFVNGYVAYRLKKEKEVDYIVAVRNTDLNIFFKYMPWMRKIGLNILRNAKKIIFISYPYREETINKYVPDKYKEEIAQKSHVLPNGVDKFWLDNIRTDKKNYSNDKIDLIYIGKIDRNKNIVSTIKAIDILRSKGYEIDFNIIGKGNYLKVINRLIKKRNYIKIHGYKNKKELIYLYEKSNIFVMPSKKETFGLVYVEALTQGLPVIYTKDQGFDGYFEDGKVGFSVNCNDIKDISSKIEALINSDLEIYKYCKDIQNMFDWNKISIEYKKIYLYTNNEN